MLALDLIITFGIVTESDRASVDHLPALPSERI
jgi:hypothetical protein